MYAVDALRQLAAKLLERAELARFTHQGEALRPFAAVLRHSGGQSCSCFVLGADLLGADFSYNRVHVLPRFRCPASVTARLSFSLPTPPLCPPPHRLLADSPAVRELAVACVAHAVSAHPTGLGSGWRSVLAALALAARDAAPTVVGQALDGLQPAVEALFRRGGHTLLR